MACDWLISPHVPSLLSAIRQQALCQYLQPYTVVNLHSMAAAFDISYVLITRGPLVDWAVISLFCAVLLNSKVKSPASSPKTFCQRRSMPMPRFCTLIEQTNEQQLSMLPWKLPERSRKPPACCC